MGNLMGMPFSRFSWPPESDSDSEGESEENMVEVEEGCQSIEEEAPPLDDNVNTSLSPRELRRRRRLQF